VPKLTLREIVGLLLIIAALVLTPVAWAFSRLLWLLAFSLFIAGIMCFYTQRMWKREEERIKKGSDDASCHERGAAVPTDIHNYTGWGSGGRSETMDSSVDSGDADAD